MTNKTIRKSRLHFLAKRLLLSAALFASFALVVRLSWYPEAHFTIDGAARRLQILASMVLVLGPVLSTLLYRPGKPSLMVDMGVLFALELAVIGVGALPIYADRPAFLVFAVDRFEVIRFAELDRQLLRYDELKLPVGSGPQLAIARLPEDPIEKSDLVSAVVLEGAADIDRRPALWHPYSTGLNDVIARGKPVSLLQPYDLNGYLADWHADSKLPMEDLLFLPLRGSVGDGALIVLRTNAKPLAVIDIYPWLG